MEYSIKLKHDDWNYILNALQYFEDKKLKASIEILKKAKYQKLSGFFASEGFFYEYKKEQIKLLNNQINQIEAIYEKITNEMEED